MMGLQMKGLIVGLLIGAFVYPRIAGKLNLPSGM